MKLLLMGFVVAGNSQQLQAPQQDALITVWNSNGAAVFAAAAKRQA